MNQFSGPVEPSGGLTSVLHELIQLLQEAVSLLWIRLLLLWLQRDRQVNTWSTDRSSSSQQQGLQTDLLHAFLLLLLLVFIALLLYLFLIVAGGRVQDLTHVHLPHIRDLPGLQEHLARFKTWTRRGGGAEEERKRNSRGRGERKRGEAIKTVITCFRRKE